MRDRIQLPAIVFCLLQLACESRREEQASVDFKPPHKVEANLTKVSPGEIVASNPIPVTGVKKVLAGKPEILNLTSNVFSAKATRIIPAGAPVLFIPNGNSFQLPKVVKAIDNPIIAGTPEIILLKEPFIKENNPESFSTIKAMHGLNSNEISSLGLDRNGNLWIGAWWGGVSKYDGRSLTNYSVAQGLSSDVVNCVQEDKNGNIWIGTTDAGINRFDGRHITQYSTKEGLSDNSISYILQDKNDDLWFATGNGLNKYDGHSFTHYTTAQGLPSNTVWCMLEDSKGNLWVSCNGGLTRFDGSTFQNYTTTIGLKEGTQILGIVEDNEGNIWFSSDQGLFKYDGKFISQFTTEGGLSSNSLSKIMKDNNGNLWIGTWYSGVIRYNACLDDSVGKESTFTHFGVEHGLGNVSIPALIQDKRSNIWIATTTGVSKYDGKLFNHIVPLRQQEVECLFADKRGNIWIGSGAGPCLNKYNGSSFARYTTEEGLIDASINQIIEDRNGDIWFASRAGADRFDGKYITHFTSSNGLIFDIVFCLVEDKKGNLWFGTERGLSKFDGRFFTNYSITHDLKVQAIYSLMVDHLDNVWIGTSNKGAYVFDGNSFARFDVAKNFSHPMVLGMLEDKNNNIWFCTGMGVNKYDGKYFTWYTTEQGLSNNVAKNLLEDKNGNIWIGTINGINQLRSGSTVSDTMQNKSVSIFKKYTISEGFLGGGTYESCITQDTSGSIWIGGNDRVANYHPEGDIPDTIPPVIQLSAVSLFNEKINWLEAGKKKDSSIILNNGSKLRQFNFSGLTAWYNQPEGLQLNYDNNYLTFHFIGITTYRPKEVRYQYFLEGLEKNWNNITDQSEATYSNLSHGKYTFKVKALNSEGYWSKELNYSFVILPPWWHTWWAYLSYALAFFVLIWMFTWYRSRQLKTENIRLEEKVSKRTKELEQSLEERYQLIKKVESQEALLKERLRISRELHDDIGSTLGSISIYSEVAKKRTAKKENTTEVLSKIGHASRELINKMSDIVWSLNPGNESFEQLQNRMMAFAAMILAPRNIRYDFIADEDLKKIQFSGEQLKNIFLIFKEALYNIVKYADCKVASISLSAINNNLVMIIKDDGKGFDSTQIDANSVFNGIESLGGNGIKNMQARADDLGADLRIHSKINEGTTIELSWQL